MSKPNSANYDWSDPLTGWNPPFSRSVPHTFHTVHILSKWKWYYVSFQTNWQKICFLSITKFSFYHKESKNTVMLTKQDKVLTYIFFQKNISILRCINLNCTKFWTIMFSKTVLNCWQKLTAADLLTNLKVTYFWPIVFLQTVLICWQKLTQIWTQMYVWRKSCWLADKAKQDFNLEQ